MKAGQAKSDDRVLCSRCYKYKTAKEFETSKVGRRNRMCKTCSRFSIPERYERLDADLYIERLKGQKGSLLEQEEEAKWQAAAPVIPGAEYLDTIPHAPWPSRAMLKRRVVLGTPDIIVRTGITKIEYPDGSVYEGEVNERKRHGNGILTWPTGDTYQGMWYQGLPHGMGVAEYASGAAYSGEWNLGDRHGSGMYFFCEHPDEPHREYAGQWRNDKYHGIGKRLSKSGTVYLGFWRKGMRHGDGICRIATSTMLDPVAAIANAVRRFRHVGETGRYGQIRADEKHEVDMLQIMGGIADWHSETSGVTVQVRVGLLATCRRECWV
uniref:Uncharacterized protein n=1 Tax=Guillardia theta TaxID=55529 RepID=A0A7S4L1R9_GUITH|mmetsp:Transcript_35524/g.111122  ORF Transcript_35524/g.111122 Transcript_35524/m.111122 type:complete len:324 (+) Transcript_35524:132-1103(+)